MLVGSAVNGEPFGMIERTQNAGLMLEAGSRGRPAWGSPECGAGAPRMAPSEHRNVLFRGITIVAWHSFAVADTIATRSSV